MIRHSMIAALAASCLVVPAAGQTGATSVVVRHADLDLSRPHDVRTLDRRIARAADAACGSVSSFDLEGARLKRRCARDTIAAASLQKDHAVLLRRSTQQASVR